MKYILSAIITISIIGCKSIADFPIDEPLKKNMDDRIMGKWKIEEDTNKNNYYLVEQGYQPNEYHIKFYNRGGTNRTYESNLHLSEIRGTRFINLSYFEPGFEITGYMFLKVLNTNSDFSKITTATFNDTTMRSLDNSAAVKAHVTKHLNDPQYYSDTVHLFKVK